MCNIETERISITVPESTWILYLKRQQRVEKMSFIMCQVRLNKSNWVKFAYSHTDLFFFFVIRLQRFLILFCFPHLPSVSVISDHLIPSNLCQCFQIYLELLFSCIDYHGTTGDLLSAFFTETLPQEVNSSERTCNTSSLCLNQMLIKKQYILQIAIHNVIYPINFSPSHHCNDICKVCYRLFKVDIKNLHPQLQSLHPTKN